MTSDHLLRKYADLAVQIGANVGEGQHVYVIALIEHAPLARAIADSAYRAGAEFVHVHYSEPYAKLYRLRHASMDSLSFIPEWYDRMLESIIDRKASLIKIAGDPEPDLLKGIEPERLRICLFPATPSLLEVSMSNESNWSIVAAPNEGWAKRILGEPDIGRLWELVASCTRLNEDDPVRAWDAHMTKLEERAGRLNELGIDELHFTGPGTDLRIGMHPRARWMAARFKTNWGRTYVPNLPTEEVFTAPDFRRTEGTVRCTRPVSLSGGVVDGLELTFRAGRVVDVRADDNAGAAEADIGRDEGATRLGEVALVDNSSTVGQTGVLFGDTLFDENAASHIAYGRAVAHVFDELPEDAQGREAMGVNDSIVHRDVMIGSPEVDVDATTAEGGTVPVLRRGDWVL